MSNNSSEQTNKGISTEAIASFVYGTIQITLSVIVTVISLYVGSKFSEMFNLADSPKPSPTAVSAPTESNPPPKLDQCSGTTDCHEFAWTLPSKPDSSSSTKTVTPPSETVVQHTITGKEFIFLLISNILSLFGIGTGISALKNIVKTGKTGTDLAILGLCSSVICLLLTIAFVWNVNLPL
jgi:hypothetical protein